LNLELRGLGFSELLERLERLEQLEPAAVIPSPWARRKPMLLKRESASNLSREDARKNSGALFQEPPRITRWPSLGPLPF
jgi:hypothetical protein